MNLEMLRRVSAGLFVLMMGVVAALPYQTTTPLARRRSAASSDDAFASDWGPGSDISVEAPTVAGQFASPPSQPSFWRRTTPSAAPPPTHPMLVLDPEQPARPVMDVEAPPAPTRLVKTSPRPSEMDAPPTPSMSPIWGPIG